MIFWLFLVVGLWGLSPYLSLLSFARKGILFLHDFLVLSGSGKGSGVCLPSFLFFPFSWKGFCSVTISCFLVVPAEVLGFCSIIISQFLLATPGVPALVSFLFCRFLSKERNSVSSWFADLLVPPGEETGDQLIFNCTWTSWKRGVLLFGVYAGVIFVSVLSGLWHSPLRIKTMHGSHYMQNTLKDLLRILSRTAGNQATANHFTVRSNANLRPMESALGSCYRHLPCQGFVWVLNCYQVRSWVICSNNFGTSWLYLHVVSHWLSSVTTVSLHTGFNTIQSYSITILSYSIYLTIVKQ